MEFESLHTLLNLLCTGSKLHICIHDISGVLEHSALSLPFSYKIHSEVFCNAAKETDTGLSLCMRCKNLSNKKAVQSGESFDGLCPYGLYELVYPVSIAGVIRCIIYISNIVRDEAQTLRMIQKASRLTGVSADNMQAQMQHTQPFIGQNHYLSMARLIEGHIRLLYRNVQTNHTADCHWAVKNICYDIETHFFDELSLKREAQLYFLNEKYVGRLFKKETGYTFHEYLNHIRVCHAAKLLSENTASVLAVSLECGFQNVTYFNRLFKREYGTTPTEYRRINRTVKKTDNVFHNNLSAPPLILSIY